MITIYKTGEQGIEVLDEITKGCWINVVDPSPEELARLRELCVAPEFITYPLDLDERPRVEREDGETMILLRVPFYQGPNADVPFTTIPLGILLDGQWIMTVCRHDHDLLRDMAAGKMRGLSTAKRNRFILQVLLAAAEQVSALPARDQPDGRDPGGPAADVHAEPGVAWLCSSIRRAWCTSRPR